jgi:hypothetical protein
MAEFFATNMSRALPISVVLLISLLMLTSAFNIKPKIKKRLIIFVAIPFWILHSIFYFSVIGKVMLLFSILLLLLSLLLWVLSKIINIFRGNKQQQMKDSYRN